VQKKQNSSVKILIVHKRVHS